jgi:hypothetical protein
MSTLLISVEAIGARTASYSCPRGTAGRIHTVRLRHRFKSASRPHSIASASFGDWNTTYDESTHGNFDPIPRHEQPPRSSEEQPSDVQIQWDSSGRLRDALDDTPSTIPVIKRASSLRIRKAGSWRIPTHLAKAADGDTAGLRHPESRYNIGSFNGYGDILRPALQSENPHAIINALTRFITIGQNKLQGHEAFHVLPPNIFSEILRCLDPEHFVGRYVDLHKNNVSPRTGSFRAFRLQTEDGIYHFCVNFMTRIESIIEARHSCGYELSLSDYKYLLRCAGVVENPRASQTVWRAMKGKRFEPDTECYNYYLSGLLRVGVSNSTQRSEIRTKYLPRSGLKGPSEVYRGYYERLGIDFKYETSKIFDDMLQRGVAGDERTFCLLMISSARVGDVEGVKAILGRVWGINVDKLMTMNEKDIRGPNSYSLDSPFRPSKTLLFALVHCFGINNMVPTALRLVDYISRKYSLTIPIEVWEDLLGLTYALSKPRTLSGETGKMSPTYLGPEAVSILWSALTAEPYNVKPNMAMYNRLIVNLLRRQRFSEARERMEEARKVHVKSVHKYGETVAVEKLQSSLFEVEDDIEGLELMQGTTAYENYRGLQREKTFQHLAQKQSRQYLYRWCRMLINLAPRSLLENPTFLFVTLPQVIYDFRLFMPRRIGYSIGTGFLSFPSGSAQLSRTLALEKEAQPWSPRKTNLIEGAMSSEQAMAEKYAGSGNYDDDHLVRVSDLDSEEAFGKS